MILLLITARADDPARGARLAGLGGCPACHTAPGGAAMAGGAAIETAWGTFYGTNLTPDPTYGLGSWLYTDFARAMRTGRGPDGHVAWPVFPYDAFTHVDDHDLRDLWAWLRALPPSATPNQPHAPRGAARLPGARATWRSLAFKPAEPVALADAAPPAARGAYLAEGLGHCAGCHTPRSSVGVPLRRRALGGSEHGPNISPHADGLGAWTVTDVVDYLATGMTPSGDFAGGEMARVIREGTSQLPDDDRVALAVWLLSQPAVADKRARVAADAPDR